MQSFHTRRIKPFPDGSDQLTQAFTRLYDHAEEQIMGVFEKWRGEVAGNEARTLNIIYPTYPDEKNPFMIRGHHLCGLIVDGEYQTLCLIAEDRDAGNGTDATLLDPLCLIVDKETLSVFYSPRYINPQQLPVEHRQWLAGNPEWGRPGCEEPWASEFRWREGIEGTWNRRVK